MASWDDVRRFALALPQTTERAENGLSWTVRDKLFAWERPLRPADLRALGDRAPKGPILAARVESLLAKDARIEGDPRVFFTTPHFAGYPAVLVRLGAISRRALEDLIVEAWLARAPQRLARLYLDASKRER
jgi:hypothetical protein